MKTWDMWDEVHSLRLSIAEYRREIRDLEEQVTKTVKNVCPWEYAITNGRQDEFKFKYCPRPENPAGCEWKCQGEHDRCWLEVFFEENPKGE